MPKRVLDVGNCSPDFRSLQTFLTSHFDCEVVQADDLASALLQLHEQPCDLILVNRKLDIDYSDGVDVLRGIKANPEFVGIPVMLITNYPEHQEIAMEYGALRGFGKLELGLPETREKLEAVLG